MKIAVRNIVKSFPHNGANLRVLDGVTLYAREGEFVTILGPSGCGKSTLFNIIAGLLSPDAGEIWIDGNPVPDGRGHVAYMQQKDLLLPWRTVLENAILGLEVQGIPREEARVRARDLLARVGLQGFERAYPSQLSGGMRQRVALVRTVLTGKEILLLDEPFGALDAMTRMVLQQYILRMWEEFRRTVLFVTHDIEEAVLLSDRIYVLSSRPAHVKEEVAVDLPRPRQVTDPSFVALKGRILALIQDEIKEAFAHAREMV
ncbi:MAG: ABC transporter ATP-binding protein [Armatimonadota bacterium]|nr:ABC transporter ATP-binding protein [Armatimonadota bacterium]MDR5703608.1 ABC transporter ATP-binding protein [Armatimonadota bacterium]MDR7435166.1 ABC transporter ATP-binding protein [Armatimonadota bacterium]